MNNTTSPLLYPYSLLCELTYRCPLQCPYCSNPVDFGRYIDGELATQEWERILSEASALGVVQVHFSGGEPLLRKDIGQIIKKALNFESFFILVILKLGPYLVSDSKYEYKKSPLMRAFYILAIQHLIKEQKRV